MKKAFTYLICCILISCNSEETFIAPPIEDANVLIIGVNTQRVFQSKFHVGLSEDQIIDRVAGLINELNFNSIRIGGTASFGGTFDPNYMGFGWSKYMHIPEVKKIHTNDNFVNEAFNFNRIALKTAQKANVSVWIDFHRFMTEEDINEALQLVDDLNVPLAGVTRDNEPYVPDRQESMEEAYLEFTNARFQNFSWPAMSIIPVGQGDERAAREVRCAALVNQYRAPGEGIEIHSYFPIEYTGTPKNWIEAIIASTKVTYSVNSEQMMLGEWSGKNQENFSALEIEAIISDYLEVLQREKIASYYQVLGTNFDEVGLYNFEKDEFNRGANVFLNR